MDRFHKLFWECYSRNCEIEKEEINSDDYESIKKMDREKLYKHFRIFIGGLLEFKNQVKNSESTELVQRNMQFESIITKLEADIRSHIAKHYQLRLEIESQKNTIEELNTVITSHMGEIRDLRLRVLQQERIIDQFKQKYEGKRNSAEPVKKNFFLDLDLVTQNDNLKSSKNNTKILTDRSKGIPTNIQQQKKFLASSKSYKSRIGHTRCKSEFTKSLKILIPQ